MTSRIRPGRTGQNDRFDFAAEVPPAGRLGPVHFIAVGGSGMSGVARLFLARGARVSGSDAVDSPTLRALAREGAEVHVGHDPTYLGQAQTVVVSSAVRESNPELAAARARGLRVLHRAQGIAALLPGRRAVAVAGANGKTTTSAMLTVALQHAGADPSYVIGSAIGAGGTNAAPGEGKAFVVEADESDGSFLAYRPQVAVVTNIKPDHLDFFGDLATIERAFRDFAGTVARDGLLVASADDPGADRLTRSCRGQVQVTTFGTGPGADLGVEPDPAVGRTGRARLTWRRDLGTGTSSVPAGTTRVLTVPMPGRHNLVNAAAALLAATAGLGHDVDAVLAGIAAYPGTSRRFEAVGVAGGVEVVDDYAHNPDKVTAVVQAGRAVVGTRGRLVVLFQPHLYSRTRDFADAFAAGLAAADVVVVVDVYGAREDPLPGVSGDLVASRLRAYPDFAGQVHYVADRSRVVATTVPLLLPGDLVLTVGAGDITDVGPQLLAALRELEDSHGPLAGSGGRSR